MRNVIIVIKHEIVTTLSKPSFWLTTFVLPVFILLMTVGSQSLAEKAFENSGDAELLSGSSTELGTLQIGYVDEAHLLHDFPPGFPQEIMQAYPDEATAQAALDAGDLARYYVIPADYIEQGKVTLVDNQFTPFSHLAGEDLMRYLLAYNLAANAPAPALLLDPLPNLSDTSLLPTAERETTNEMGYDSEGYIVSFAVLFIFFLVLTMSGGFMLQSVSKEKENRVVEVLLLSLRPRELMLGKLLGLGTVALLQMGIWLGGGLLSLEQSQKLITTARAFTLPPGFIGWALLYFLCGYLLYASLLGALGALAPNAREGSQFTFFVLLPLMVPLWLQSTFVEAPHGGLVTFLSIFPLTSPVSMMTRLTAGGVPLWQLLVSVALLAVTAYGFVLLAAHFFRADTLLSNAALNWKRLREELLGRKMSHAHG